MEVFESLIYDTIKQERYESILNWTKQDFFENGLAIYGSDEINQALLEIDVMLHSEEIGADEKFKIFMAKYNKYESERKLRNLLLKRS